MQRLIAFVSRGSKWILAVTLVLTVLAALRLGDIGYDDDITAFLPQGDPEVGRFWRVGEMFGGLNIAIVGVEVPAGEGDLFTRVRVQELLDLSGALSRVPGVRSVSGLATVRDIQERTRANGEKESVVADLIPAAPSDPAGLDALRKRILGADHLVGGLVSGDGQATLILAHLDDRESALETAGRIRKLVADRDLPSRGLRAHLGGAPFINEGLARAAEEDLKVLGPVVALVILLVVLLSFRNLTGAVLSILPVGIAIVMTVGLMAALDVPLTLISSSLPVVVLALGSAYPIHVVARTIAVVRERGEWSPDAVREALRRVGAPVFFAGLTTVVGFLSFQAIDIAPMRVFGLYMAAGIAIATAIALLVVPAALLHFPVAPRSYARSPLDGAIAWLQRAVPGLHRHSVLVLVAVALVSAAGAVGVVLVDSDMSTSSYFTRETDEVRADRFLSERFGGSLYLQLLVEGDIRDPLVLEELARLEDFARAVPGVSDVRSVTEVIRLANRGLLGMDALPRELGEVANLAALAEGEPAVRMLVTADWRAALVQVRLGGFDTEEADRVIATLRGYIEGELASPAAVVAWQPAGTPKSVRDAVMGRAAADLERVLYDTIDADPERRQRIVEGLRAGLSAEGYLRSKAFREAIRARLDRDLVEDELVYVEGGETAVPEITDAVLAAMAQGPLSTEATEAILLAHAEEDERAEALAAKRTTTGATPFQRAAAKVHRGLRELQDEASRDAAVVALRGATASAPGWKRSTRSARAQRIAQSLTDDSSFVPVAVAREAGAAATREAPVSIAVSGYPVLWSGMNASIRANQVKSVAISVALILLILAVLFRSFWVGLFAMLPSAITLLVSFGALGFLGTPIDMGSTMISSIAFGVGIDYAIHFLWCYRLHVKEGRFEAGAEALRVTGPAVVVNALEVGLGFGLLAFGTVAPMSRFGFLTGETMLLAAAATLFLLPLLLWRIHVRPGTQPAPAPAAAVDESVEPTRL